MKCLCLGIHRQQNLCCGNSTTHRSGAQELLDHGRYRQYISNKHSYDMHSSIHSDANRSSQRRVMRSMEPLKKGLVRRPQNDIFDLFSKSKLAFLENSELFTELIFLKKKANQD